MDQILSGEHLSLHHSALYERKVTQKNLSCLLSQYKPKLNMSRANYFLVSVALLISWLIMFSSLTGSLGSTVSKNTGLHGYEFYLLILLLLPTPDYI